MRHILLICIGLIFVILPISAQDSSARLPITADNAGQLREITSFPWTNEDTLNAHTEWNPINGRVLIHEYRGAEFDYQPTIIVWDSLTDEIIFQLRPDYHQSSYRLDWNEDGTLLLLSQQKDDAKGVNLALWAIDTGELIAEFDHVIPEFLSRYEILWLDNQIYVSTSTINWGEGKTEDSIGTYLSVFDTAGNLLNSATSEWLSNYLIPSPDETRILAFMETSFPGQSPIIFDRDGNLIAELNQSASNTLDYNPYAVWSADSRRILTFNYNNTVRYSTVWGDAGDPRLWTADGELIVEITTPYDDYRDGILWNDDLTRFALWNNWYYPDSSFFGMVVNERNEIIFELSQDSTPNNEDSNLLNITYITWNPDQSLFFWSLYRSSGQSVLEIWSDDAELILQTDRNFSSHNAVWSADNRRFLLPIQQFSRDCILENVVLELWDMEDLTRPQARMLYTGFLDFFWNADESLIYGRVSDGFIWEGCSFTPEHEIVIWNNHGDRLFEAPISASHIELNADETQLFVHAENSVAIWGVTTE